MYDCIERLEIDWISTSATNTTGLVTPAYLWSEPRVGVEV